METFANPTRQDQSVWKQLFTKQSELRDVQIVPEFSEGLRLLGIDESRIPSLETVNERLKKISGWQGVYVKGFISPVAFFEMLAKKTFPVGNFIRSEKHLSYTPEPDIFHDLYGHIPFFTSPDYAQFAENFGRCAIKYSDSPQIIEEFQRLYWFGIEFSLIKTEQGLRIFGAGIASSFLECTLALSGTPRLLPFDPEVIRKKQFRIDVVQDNIFVIESRNQLYSCLDQFEKNISKK
jgi:phenylalanine-4-hydroxylase